MWIVANTNNTMFQIYRLIQGKVQTHMFSIRLCTYRMSDESVSRFGILNYTSGLSN